MIRDANLLVAYLKDLIDGTPDGALLVNSAGRIVVANGLAEWMFGYGPGQLQDLHLGSLIPQRFRGAHARHCLGYFSKPRKRGMGAGIALKGLRKDGTEFPVDICLSPLETDQGTFVWTAIRDLNERDEMSGALLTQLAIGIVHSGLEGQILDANPRFCEMTRYPREELLAMKVSDVTHPEDMAKSLAARSELRSGRQPFYDRETRLVRKGGEEFWAQITTAIVRNIEGEPIHYLSAIRDISELKRSEEARENAELRFRQIAENIREVFWLTDTSKQEVLYVSPAYEAIWGRKADALHESPLQWIDAIHAADRDGVLHAVQAQVAGAYDVEYRIVRPNGDIRWIRDRAFPVRDEKSEIVRVAGVAEDITERKNAIDALRESERRLSTILQRVQMVALMLDTEARITYCNDYLLTLSGWSREEVVGNNWFDLFLPKETWEELRGVFTSLLADLPDAWQYENDILTRAGKRRRIRWYNTLQRSASGQVIGTASIGEDITDRQRAESALKESEARFRAMIEQSISGTCIIDAESRFVYVNPRLVSILGYDAAEAIIGRPVLDFVKPEDRALVADNMRDRVAGLKKSARYSFCALRKDGSTVLLGAHGTVGVYEGKRVVIATVQDVTELHRAEQEVARMLAKLHRAVQSTIEVVSTIGEMRDPYTHGHEHRVGEIATAIAAEMGLPGDRIEGVRIAGYLHDVGKIAVPAEILAKPTRLTKHEFELVKQHAQQSYEILKRVEFPWPVAEAAWQHHERLDGTGYPNGLKGKEIILEARILAVADTVEAMASHRPYRPGLGIERALTEIARGRATIYDPQVVDACLRLFREKAYAIPS